MFVAREISFGYSELINYSYDNGESNNDYVSETCYFGY